jgi:hypothetical protein
MQAMKDVSISIFVFTMAFQIMMSLKKWKKEQAMPMNKATVI